MGTSVSQIRKWLMEAKANGSTHVVIVCDTFDWEDYPVEVKPGQDPKKVTEEHSKNMQKILEVYDLNKDIEVQLDSKIKVLNY